MDKSDNRFKFSKCVELTQVEVDNQQMIINGVPQKMLSTVAVCPNCGRVVYEFGQVPLTYAINVCNEYVEKLEKLIAYCPQCGQKIHFPTIIEEK